MGSKALSDYCWRQHVAIDLRQRVGFAITEIAREGSIARAAEQLHLAHPTISNQLHQLESFFEDKLFDHVGRNPILTEFGQTVFRYAEEIFSVGRELQDAVKGRPGDRPL